MALRRVVWLVLTAGHWRMVNGNALNGRNLAGNSQVCLITVLRNHMCITGRIEQSSFSLLYAGVFDLKFPFQNVSQRLTVW